MASSSDMPLLTVLSGLQGVSFLSTERVSLTVKLGPLGTHLVDEIAQLIEKPIGFFPKRPRPHTCVRAGLSNETTNRVITVRTFYPH